MPPANQQKGTIYPYLQYNQILFTHFGKEYVCQDKDYIKNTAPLFACESLDDGLAFYNHIQKSAATFNILVQPIENIRMWSMDPNTRVTTCAIEYKNDTSYYQVYQASATALFTKISKANFNKVPIFKEFVKDATRSGEPDGASKSLLGNKLAIFSLVLGTGSGFQGDIYSPDSFGYRCKKI